MKRSVNIVIALCVAIVLYSGCKKEDYHNNTPVVVVPDKTKLYQLFSSLRGTPQTFTVTAGTYQTVTASGGTKLKFYPNSFKDASGNIITSGTVTLQITEAYKVGAMIANMAVPVSTDGRQLISGGEVKIKATMGGQEVFANKYSTSFKQPATSTQPMELFIGTTDSDSVTTWTPADTTGSGTSAGGGTTLDTSGITTAYYTFDSCNHFNWINCDHFYSCGCTLTDINFDIVDTTFNAYNTAVFVIFPSINSVGNAYPGSGHDFAYNNVPVGTTIDIVCVSVIGTNYYYCHQTGITTAAGLVVNPVMTAQTLSYITAALAAL
ncbi:hypothetical protein [Flavipsychrobacter stenotrophus]|uniref:hypothetical protein n=1 Tax=Flavipsychrobacter stenotrophus TaxID=2077091 RepID=UPI0010572245|nr:hypothetical protein [Flavipsychrobacter stenotrophus]